MQSDDLDAVYDSDFYSAQGSGSARAATVVVPCILDVFPVTSVVDFGCGVGAWLKEFSEAGVSQVLGLEGGSVPESQLQIPAGSFRKADFTDNISVGDFDLAISLEVAEHLPIRFADHFFGLLTDAAPLVLFSAAIPGKGGANHLNEQWQTYWCERFARHDYEVFDIIRPRIWKDARIPVWYRQNTLLFCRRDYLSQVVSAEVSKKILDVVHPELWTTRLKKSDNHIPRPKSITQALRTIVLCFRVIGRRIVSRLSSGWIQKG